MCFDNENLVAAMRNGNLTFRKHCAIDLYDFNDESGPRIKSVLPDREFQISIPITIASRADKVKQYIQRQKVGHSMSRNYPSTEILESHSLDRLLTSRQILPVRHQNLNFLEGVRVSLQATTRALAASVSRDFGPCRTERRILDDGDIINSSNPVLPRCSTTADLPEISKPVVRRGNLSQTKSPSSLLGPDTRPCERQVKGSNSLSQLQLYRKPPFSCERGLWCRGAREVLRRTPIPHRSLLRSLPVTIYQGRALCTLKGSVSVISKSKSSYNRLTTLFRFMKGLATSTKKKRSYCKALKEEFKIGLRQHHENIKRAKISFKQKLSNDLNKFDPPPRFWSSVHCQKIISRYEHLQGQAGNVSITGKEMDLTENNGSDSQESVVEDFLPSDQDVRSNDDDNVIDFLGAFAGAREVCSDADGQRSSGSCGTRETRPNAKKQNDHRGSFTQGKEKVSLHVPDGLLCTPWIIETAVSCIHAMPKAAVFSPPSLSVLPVLTILAFSFLKNFIRDERIIIVSEVDTDVIDGIRSYLRESLGRRISVDSVRRRDYPVSPSVAPIQNATTRVLILDSFNFQPQFRIGLLFVIQSNLSLILSEIQPAWEGRSGRPIPPHWKRITHAFIISLEPGICVKLYLRAVEHFSVQLGIMNVLFVKEEGDVHLTALMSRPRVLFMPPSLQASEFVNILDNQSSAYLASYGHEQNPRDRGNSGESAMPTKSLAQLSYKRLRALLHENTMGRTDASVLQQLEVLHAVRQARSFALYDGFEAAIAFIKHCIENSHTTLKRKLEKILKKASNIGISSNFDSTHPMLPILRLRFKKARKQLDEEAPSIRAIHCKTRFQPLIIANSQDAADRLRQDIRGAKPFSHERPGHVGLCTLREIVEMCNMKGNTDTEVIQKKLDKYSHIYHILDDRNDGHSDMFLPPPLLHLIHSGRVRLLVISVDETQKLSRMWDVNEKRYQKMSNAVTELQESLASGETYLHTLSIGTFLDAIRDLILESPRSKVSNRKSHTIGSPRRRSSFNQGSTDRAVRPSAPLPTDHDTQVLYIEDECFSGIVSAGNKLRTLLAQHPLESLPMKVEVHIKAHQGCSPGLTYLNCAIASDGYLHENIVVRVIMEF